MSTVGIIGAGTMGAGIAQVAVTHGWDARLLDVDAAVIEKAIAGVQKRLDRLVEKGRMTADQRSDAAARLKPAGGAEDLRDCDLVVEAVVEDMDVKVKVLRAVVDVVGPETILATNTSSLSVSGLGEMLGEAHRVVGMHFFNPAPLMKLVEIVAGRETQPTVADRVAGIATAWEKQVARAADVPGFIVNHVARPYYLEAFRILEDGYTTPDRIDATMRDHGGFRMGPLELTDLIGQDVNTATTRSVWDQLDHPPLLHPSRMQESLVAAGHLGRKTGRGVYDHTVDTPRPALIVDPRPFEPSPELTDAALTFAAATGAIAVEPIEAYVLARIGAALIVQAHAAHARGVATKADIDTAMRYGVNYPRGPFEWAETVGDDVLRGLLTALDAQIGDGRFALAGTPSAA